MPETPAVPHGVNVEPIPYDGRLLRCVRRQQEHAVHARILERIARETDGDVAQERRRLHAATPADGIALRGIPAIGPGMAGGAIAGTRPDVAVIARESRR